MSSCVSLLQGDCLKLLPNIPTGSVDLILTDLPYGSTNLPWDEVVPLGPLWDEVRRVLTPTGTFITTSAGLFTGKLMMAAPDLYKYTLIWKKSRPTGHLLVKRRPMLEHEDILVFSKGTTVHPGQSPIPMTYNPQGLQELATPRISRNGLQSGLYNNNGETGPRNGLKAEGYPTFNGKRVMSKEETRTQKVTGYPKSVLEFASVHKPVHSTQKPVDLFEYLIRTYSNEGETVLDPTMGSGTTGVAAWNTKRNFIGIEQTAEYFKIASDRINGVSSIIPR